MLKVGPELMKAPNNTLSITKDMYLWPKGRMKQSMHAERNIQKLSLIANEKPAAALMMVISSKLVHFSQTLLHS